MVNLHILFLLPALSMTTAKPIPIEFNAELDPTSYNDPIPQNLGGVQEGPTLENSNTAYSGTTFASWFSTAQIPNQLHSSFVRDSPSGVADVAPVNTGGEDGSKANCCEQKKLVECDCDQPEKDREGQSDGQSGRPGSPPEGQSGSPSEGQSGRPSEGQLRRPSEGQPGRPSEGQRGANGEEGRDSRPGIWQIYVEPWICQHVRWKSSC